MGSLLSKENDGVGSQDRLPRDGKDEEVMKRILPSEEEDADMVRLLKALSDGLATPEMEKTVRSYLNKRKSNGSVSARWILGDRYEVYLSSAEASNTRSTDCFDAIILQLANDGLMPRNAKELILDYCVRQAMKDARVGNKYDFQNFSMVINYAPVEEQAPHVDLFYPNYQFGLIVTDESSGTLVYDRHIRSVDDLIAVWDKLGESMGQTGPSPQLVSAMKNNSLAKRYIEHYGDVLTPYETHVESGKYFEDLQTGTLLSTPGSITHAGPATDAFRVVIFFSARPREVNVPGYNADNQFVPVSLLVILMSELWRDLGLEDRRFLLRMLEWCLESDLDGRDWSEHYKSRGMHVLASLCRYISDGTMDEGDWDAVVSRRDLFALSVSNDDKEERKEQSTPVNRPRPQEHSTGIRLRPQDVLLGRGPNIFNHAGNRALLCLQRKYVKDYDRARHNRRRAVATLVTEKVWEAGGRFLRKAWDDEKGRYVWIEVDTAEALGKVSQGMRDERRRLNREAKR